MELLRNYVDTPFGQIHYREEGSGEPLLLLHQTADSSAMWAPVIPLFSSTYRVIAMDTLGFGDSDKPSEPPGIEGYAKSVAAFLDGLGIRRTRVVGHHTGASIASEFASMYPDRVVKLVLSGQPDYDPDVRPQKIANITSLEITEDGAHLPKVWQRVAPGMQKWATPEQIHQAVVDTLKAGPKYYFSYLAVFTQDVRTRIPNITAPTLLTSGENDIFVQRQEELVKLFKSPARTHVFKGAGALTMFESTDEFVKVVGDFLAE